jgi:Domain of unknown function (DUF4173)
MFPSKMVAPLILAGAVLFNFIFWQELLALNALLFDAFIISTVFFYYPRAIKDTSARWVLLAHLICLFTLLWHNSLLSKIAYSSTLLLFIGFAQYAHRSLWFAGGSAIMNFLLFIASFFEQIRHTPNVNRKSSAGKFIRFAIFPVLLLVVFFLMYSLANGVLAKWTSNLGIQIDELFLKFFDLFSIQRILFLLLGFYITGSLLLRSKIKGLEMREATLRDKLMHKRMNRQDGRRNWWYDIIVGVMGKFGKGIVALKNENTVGVISLVLLNILLLIVNSIDISHLWVNFKYGPDINLFAMIHEGTELLIFSIILAMLVLLFFFRGNLNFYTGNRWLKIGAYAWILQNIVLVMSVLIRDYHYIVQFGLAYKRIGVLFFLAMVLVGLTTVLIKIWYKTTVYFLLRMNAWSALVLLVLGSMVNWDAFITKYNIVHRNEVPLNLPYLLTFSDKILPIFEENREILRAREKQLNKLNIKLDRCTDCIDDILNTRERGYLKEQRDYSWLSWNYSDAAMRLQFNTVLANTPGKQ